MSSNSSNIRNNKVNSPIGLEIDAATPEEIEFSITAQVIKHRRLINTTNGNDSLSKFLWPGFDKYLLINHL